MTYYTLNDHGEPVETSTPPSDEEWRDPRRVVAKTTLDDGTMVSTVFLCFDHRPVLHVGAPVLFESLAFTADGVSLDDTMVRYETRTAAALGHTELVRRLCAERQTTVATGVAPPVVVEARGRRRTRLDD